MTRWEYWTSMDVGSHKLDQELAERGEDGWELVAVFRYSSGSEFDLFYKREKNTTAPSEG